MIKAAGTRDEGFTLIELLITITMLGIVIVALGQSIVLGLKTTDTTNSRLVETHDAQIAAVYFPPDAASASSVRRDVVTCAEATAAGETPVAYLKWTESGVAKVASYFVKTVGSEKQLIRRKCSGGSLANEVVISHNISATTDPVISCSGTGMPCPATGTGTTFTAVTITITETTGYVFSLTGAKRSV